MKRLILISGMAGLFLAPGSVPAQELAANNTAVTQEAGMSFFSFVPAKPAAPMKGVGLIVMPWASDMTKAQAAYQKGDFVAARESLTKASDQGNIIATWYLGHIYRLGRGVPADSAMAFEYYAKVVDAFSPDEANPQRLKVMIDALVRVADTYRTGNGRAGIEADPGRAYGMFNTAASFGHPAAHYALGMMTLNGNGVRRNPELGVKWLMLAARKRFAPAEAALGEIYWQGGIVPQDRVRALMWYKLAQQTAEPSANPEIFDRGDALEAQVTESERADAMSRAKMWSEKYPATVLPAATASLTSE